MTLFILAFVAGVLTLATPCILPVLPFVFAQTGRPFHRHGLPMLLGLAFSFAAAASLVAIAGGWVVTVNEIGRNIALGLMALFGLSLLFPVIATRLTAPLSRFGEKLLPAGTQPTTLASLLLGVATGLIWAPCAGPVLGLILTGAALRGPSFETTLLLFTYALGAALALAIGLMGGGRLLAAFQQSARKTDGLRRVLGGAVVIATLAIAGGVDTGLLTRLSSGVTDRVEHDLIAGLKKDIMPTTINSASAAEAPLSEPLAALLTAKDWLNTPPLTAADLRGKVVLVNFWTYSCINCLRTLPYVRAWAEAYKDQGLVVIGVHTPEFAFERNERNVDAATHDLDVTYPVALDNDFAIWRAFGNQGWPALFFIGADGEIRHSALGEGNYAESEDVLRRLLSEANSKTLAGNLATIHAPGAQAAPDLDQLGSGETYIGYNQASRFASPESMQPDVAATYHAAAELGRNEWSLAGNWNVGGEFATSMEMQAGITYRFHARDLHLVMAPPQAGLPVRFQVTLDGKAPGADHGADVDAAGFGTVTADRLYQLVRQQGPVDDRLFEIRFLDPGIRAYAFTFG